LEERVFSHPAVKEVLRRFVCVRLDGRESAENRALKLEYGPVVMGNVQNRIVSPSGENLARLPTDLDVPELVDYLERWAAVFPGEEQPATGERPLPYFATLHQALNVAACDARVLVVVMSPPATRVEDMLRPLAWEAEFAGRLHFVRADPDDPRLGPIRGLEPAPDGAYLVIPDEYGMAGELSAQLGPDTEPNEVLDAARAALQRHASQFEPRTVVEKLQRHGERGESDWYYLVQT
jgi:hypothetical protein